MSTKADALIQKVQRGERVAAIREALGLTGEEFAKKLADTAKSFGLLLKYDKHKVSRMESGGRKITVEESALLTYLDPKKRGVAWLVFGTRGQITRERGAEHVVRRASAGDRPDR